MLDVVEKADAQQQLIVETVQVTPERELGSIGCLRGPRKFLLIQNTEENCWD